MSALTYLERAGEQFDRLFGESGDVCVVCREHRLTAAEGNYVCATCTWAYAGQPVAEGVVGAPHLPGFEAIDQINRMPRPVPPGLLARLRAGESGGVDAHDARLQRPELRQRVIEGEFDG